MKSFQLAIFVLVLSLSIIVEPICSIRLSNDNPQNVVVDSRDPNSVGINQVVRRNPTVAGYSTTSAYNMPRPKNLSFSTSGTTNFSETFGKTATIVSKIYFLIIF